MELEPYEKEKKFVDHVIDATERGNSTHTVLSKQFTIIFNIMSMYVVCVNENIFLNQWSLYNLLYFNEFHSDVSTLFRFTSYKYTSCLAILLLFIVFFFFFLFHLCMFRLYSRIKMNNLCFALKSSDDELKLKWMQQEKKIFISALKINRTKFDCTKNRKAIQSGFVEWCWWWKKKNKKNSKK